MQVFVTGANGWIGSALVKELIEAGHQVVGLVRSEQKAHDLRAAGAKPVLGSLSDLEVLKHSASQADGVVHLAFSLDMSKILELSEQDRQTIKAFGDVYTGSDRPVIVTSGFGFLPPGEVFTEETPPPPVNPAFPHTPEQTATAIAARGVRATWVRLPRTVHGVGEQHGFVPELIRLAREKKVSAYVGEGQNLWPAVHRLDAVRVFRLALEHGTQDGPFHAVAEEGVPFRQIAEVIGNHLGVPTRSISPDEAAGHFSFFSGFGAMFAAGNGPASSDKTRASLGWEPREIGLISDIDRPEYYG
ncbi:MAG: SDR family oxidoreductase [Fibrella sp.]|nr:SDR family oxidoreductase [Armatimonadota bacterium]